MTRQSETAFTVLPRQLSHRVGGGMPPPNKENYRRSRPSKYGFMGTYSAPAMTRAMRAQGSM